MHQEGMKTAHRADQSEDVSIASCHVFLLNLLNGFRWPGCWQQVNGESTTRNKNEHDNRIEGVSLIKKISLK